VNGEQRTQNHHAHNILGSNSIALIDLAEKVPQLAETK
jgi:hypothetical protein